MGGPGFWDWTQVQTVLGAWGIPLGPDLHRKLRLLLFEAMKLEKEERDKEKKNNGK